MANIDGAEIIPVVHWIGGVHSEMRLPKRRRCQRNGTSADVIAAVRQLVLIANDDLIAVILNRDGLKTRNGNRCARERLTSMRSSYRIPVFKPAEDGTEWTEPGLSLSNVAKLPQIAPKTLRLAAGAGEIEAIHPRSDGPWIFARAAFTTSAARLITGRARQNPRYPAGSQPESICARRWPSPGAAGVHAWSAGYSALPHPANPRPETWMPFRRSSCSTGTSPWQGMDQCMVEHGSARSRPKPGWVRPLGAGQAVD